jgi:hypothetical protein
MLLGSIFGAKMKSPKIRAIRKVKHSKQPAQSCAKHGTVLLKGKIREHDEVKA